MPTEPMTQEASDQHLLAYPAGKLREAISTLVGLVEERFEVERADLFR